MLDGGKLQCLALYGGAAALTVWQGLGRAGGAGAAPAESAPEPMGGGGSIAVARPE